ncbi:BCL-6 corepressor-like protein 1 isoform X2 [Entelurus aequoreus]|uniref:BCL-6 corepressor-like protein 1 isoform X2 n=1 Tax=Entelurus aequoreus TaxID=161455 RepID=UPI002B1D8459|nr:BCL-6 corepressor-like protein 1 isoform X2 [Entelurus aequoreus]
MQVDSSLMNVGDGGTVSRETSAPNKASMSMVGNPPQTLPLEFRSDVSLSQQNKTTPTTDCKTARACPDTDPAGSEKRADKRVVEVTDGAAVFTTPQWQSGVKVGRQDSANPRNHSKKSHAPSAGFQCSLFKAAQPVAFLPSGEFSSPLRKITLPPALGQIAALREATASQFSKESQPQTSGVAGAPLMRTYHYPFSVGRTPAPEKKASKLKVNHSSSKKDKSIGESVVASPAIALPLQHPSLNPGGPTHYTLSPTAAICCGSALATIASQSRLLNHVEKGLRLDKAALSSLKAEDRRVACSLEPRDVPLDLSAKSKRLKCTDDPSSEPPNTESNFLNSKRNHSTTFSSAGKYPTLPNTHRNGSHQKQSTRLQNHQLSELKPPWSKGPSQDPIKSIPGTYVGVASPILASTLRGKDGKGTFADEFQSFAKQEFISIIDQGEQVSSGGKRPPCKNTSKNCPAKGALMTALSSPSNTHPKPGKAASLTWQKSSHPPHQASSAHRNVSPESPKAKGTVEGSKFQSPSTTVDETWEKQSPLSNLASIVKQQDPVSLRNDTVLNLLTASQDPPSKQAPPAFWSSENWLCPGGLTRSRKRFERLKAVETSENKAELPKQGQPQSLRSSASTNGNRLESQLAQVLEGEALKKDSGDSESPGNEKLGGLVASLLSGDKCEERTNGTKEDLPSKAVKVKKVSPKKPAKAELSKKTAGEKEEDTGSPTTGSYQKKKKQKSPELEQRLSLRSKDQILKDRTSPKEDDHVKTDGGSSPEGEETRAFNSPLPPAGSSFPRLRRGRRRADEARLDLWGFATPSPPPPTSQMSPSPPPRTPARRPRGRPRSSRLLERDDKGKVADAQDDSPAQKRRRHCRSRKYQTGEYVTEKDKAEDGEHLEESDSGVPEDSNTPRCPSPATSSPESPPRRPSFTRSGSARYQASDGSPEPRDKPSGKRKFKSKHLCEGQKTRIKRSGSGKRSASTGPDESSPPPSASKSLVSWPPSKKESPPKRPVPPEVRRLIVNKNAGETLLQRAARLGYQEVVQYCLEKDLREVNRRDNAGYTALHEACSRGWTQIVQMLLRHGADVNCSAQDGTRPLHDAVASDNLPIVWLLLNHGADPTLATYSGHTPVKLAHSCSMKAFLTEYFSELEGRSERDWDFYSSSLFEDEEKPCWDFLLSEETSQVEECSDQDFLLFELSSQPLLPCYHLQLSVTQGFCNWFLLSDVLTRLKMSPPTFRARHPHLEVGALPRGELLRQVLVSQVGGPLDLHSEEEEEEEEAGLVELLRCVPEVQRLLGSSIHILQDQDPDQDQDQERRGR